MLPVVGFLSLFHFSYKETAHPTVVLRAGALRPIELELRKTVEVSGNMHGPSNPFAKPSVRETSDWLYFDKPSGTISANDLIFTHWRACPDELWWQKNMQGSITVNDSEVIIELQMPRYDTGNPPPSRYVPWEHNGKYKVQRVEGTPTPLNLVCGKG
jgi:hypothetical protein